MRLTRRRALTATATLSAAGWRSLARGQGPSRRLRVGVIGMGVRGKSLIGDLPPSARVTAICDCARSRIDRTMSPDPEFVQTLAGFIDRDAAGCQTYQDYRRMLDRQPLDAVVIAAPDHHHVQMATAAVRAGLDVYLEKPVSVTIDEGRFLAGEVSRSGRILQVGSQQRSMEVNRFACEFIRDGGLGKITRIDSPNYPGPLANPLYAAQPIPDGLDWNLFLGPTAMRPYHRNLWVKDEYRVGDLMWRGWDLFRDYSGHLMTNWGAHNLDNDPVCVGDR